MTHSETIGKLDTQLGELSPLFDAVSDERARRRPSEGIWSPKEVAVHLRQVERLMRIRIERILGEERPFFPVYDPSKLAEAATYIDEDLPVVFDEFALLRAGNLLLVRDLDDTELARIGVHEAKGELPLSLWLGRWVAHTDHHLAQIRERLEA